MLKRFRRSSKKTAKGSQELERQDAESITTGLDSNASHIRRNQRSRNETSDGSEHTLSGAIPLRQQSTREAVLERPDNLPSTLTPQYQYGRNRSGYMNVEKDSLVPNDTLELASEHGIVSSRWSVGPREDAHQNQRRYDPHSIITRPHFANTRLEIDPHSASNNPIRTSPKAFKTLRYDQYTVGWICALTIEMAAAKAMLDELHVSLPNPSGDHNAYQLGSIGGHNVVITCLPAGVYGTTSATATAIAMCSTYPNCNMIPLLVGIGGGVPAPQTWDIRLGDVVISTPSPERPAVVQFDYGKTEQDGKFHVKGSLNKPAPALLSALTHFRSGGVESSTNKILEHMSKATINYPLEENDFSYPGIQKDVLLSYGCQHSTNGLKCGRCPVQAIVREPRQHTHPYIKYGSIASGTVL